MTPEELWNALSPAERRALRWPSPSHLARELSYGEWQLTPHLDYIAKTVRDRIVKGGARLILTVPPRHGKSELCSVWLPTWHLSLRPRSRIGIIGYGITFTRRWGRRIRAILREFPEALGIHIDPEKEAADEFETLEGAYCLSTGIEGRLTGIGFDLMVIDDPHKDRAESESPTMREKVVEWWQSTARNRLEPNGSVVVIMQRWREDDLVGFLLSEESGEDWEIINLPALAEEGDPIGRKVGEALWPERYPLPELEKLRLSTNSYNWASQYQQRPAPAGGSIFRREHFRYWAEEAGNAVLRRPEQEPRRIPLTDCTRIQTADTGLKAKTVNDPTACGTFLITPDNDLLVEDMAVARLEVPDQMPFLLGLRARYQPLWQGVEDKASGIGLVQEAARRGQPFHILKADTDKVSRASAASILYENGKVYHRAGAPWLNDFEAELLAFPNGKHDDQVDVTAYAAQEVGSPAPGIFIL